MVDLLLDDGAREDIQNNDGLYPANIFLAKMTLAEKRSALTNIVNILAMKNLTQDEQIVWLQAYSQYMNACNEFPTITPQNHTLLHDAVLAGEVICVIALLKHLNKKQKQRYVNMADIDGNTPLHQAVSHGHWGMVDLLLDAGAREDIQNYDGLYPANVFLAKMTLAEKRAALTNIVNILAMKNLTQDEQIVWLQAYSQYMNACNEFPTITLQNHTVLHDAVLAGEVIRVIALLKHLNKKQKQHYVNMADIDGRTPLHEAATLGWVAVAAALIANGADINAVAKDGATPLDAALKAEHAPMAIILRAAGAKIGADLRGASSRDLASSPLEQQLQQHLSDSSDETEDFALMPTPAPVVQHYTTIRGTSTAMVRTLPVSQNLRHCPN
jgi:ankyrin repeat protein